jgi:hypothetical protein
MRKLPPLQAIGHALNSVVNYAGMAVRFGRFWVPILFLLGLLEWQFAPPPPADPTAATLDSSAVFIQLLTAAGSLVAICSIAVSWHRFILRDEIGPPLRLDRETLRYCINTLIIMLMVLGPILMLALVSLNLPPASSIVLFPAALLLGSIATRLSIKLPAVALGRTDFGFREAWNVSEGNFWPLAAVFALNAAAVLVSALVLLTIIAAFERIAPLGGAILGIALMAVFQLFYTVFNASIFTSLYGFFVERRDF